MNYELAFDDKVLDFLNTLPKHIRARIFSKVLSCKENPHRFFKRLVGRVDYRLRIGDYRVIADIDDSSRKIEITLIGHRKQIYKN